MALVAIVGGGPAGLSTALFLRALAPAIARDTIVLERGFYPREKICAGAVGARALSLLDEIGARPDVPHVDIRGISATTRFGTVSWSSPVSAGWVVRRAELDAALAATAIARGIEIRQGAHVAEVVPGADGVAITMKDGTALRAEVVVGADGVGSVVRKSCGWKRGAVVAQAVEVDVEPRSSDRLGVVHFDMTQADLRGYTWDFPTPLDGRTRISRGVYDLGPRTLDPSARLERMVEGDRVVGAVRRFSERGVDLTEKLSRPRVLLAGEAAGIDPVLGEGIAQAIFYGREAARYLAGALPARRTDFGDYAPLSRKRRLGVDLGIRTRALPHVYGAMRPALERLVARSIPLARAGLDYFAGHHVSRLDLVRCGLHALLSYVEP